MASELTGHVDPGTTYLVTGGAGFIGSHLVEVLLTGGARVRVLDDFSTGKRENLEPFLQGYGSGVAAEEAAPERSDGGAPCLEIIEGDITDPATCFQAAMEVGIIFHQAALPSVPRSIADPVRSHAVNATGTLNVLLAAREAGVRRVVYASSSSAYGDTPTLPKVESQTPSPRSPYAVAKLAGEQYVRSFPGVFGVEAVALRYFNVFGPRQDPDSPYAAVLPLFAKAALEGRSPTINGDGEHTRDFTHIDNVVLANLLAASAPAELVSGEVFNVGCGDRVSLNDLWAEVRGTIGAEVEAVHGPPRPGDVKDSLADLTLIRDRMGYEVMVPLGEGIRRTVEWIRGEEG
ncbi:SDR family oxidoreductase [Gemmatimonadota bacterium]